jgi:hypothetical protein
MNTSFNEIPAGLLIPLIILVVVQIGVEVLAIIKLLQTPDDRLVFGKKWPWLVIILFVNLVGAIIFLAAGRKPAAASDPLAGQVTERSQDRAAHAADVLYGPKDGEQ